MKENKITKHMTQKENFTFQYITMTFILFTVIFTVSIGIFAISNLKAIAMDRNDRMQVSYMYKDDTPSVQPMLFNENTGGKSESTAQNNVDDNTPKYVNLGRFRLTAYCSCSKCCEKYANNRPKDKNGNEIVYTASGKIAKANYTIAADPSVLPYGTIIYINGQKFEVQDCGGAIKGNRIDIYFDNHEDAREFGVQYADVFVENY